MDPKELPGDTAGRGITESESLNLPDQRWVSLLVSHKFIAQLDLCSLCYKMGTCAWLDLDMTKVLICKPSLVFVHLPQSASFIRQ